MKSIRTILLTLLILPAAFTLTACLDSSTDTGFEPQTPVISLDQDALTVSHEASDLTLTLNSNLPWRLKTDLSWVTFPQVNGSGSQQITIKVQRNRLRDQRSGTITAYITDDSKAVFRLTQSAAPAGEPIIYYAKADGDPDADGMAWETATTLPTAMENAGDGDKICLAAGTYKPTALLTGGEDEKEKTFEIFSNFTLEGGYPADAQTGAVADAAANPTVLSGKLPSGESVYHVVTVTAEKSNQNRAALKNLTITDGVTYATNETLRRLVGGALIDAGLGGGLYVGVSNLDVVNCTISGNTGCHSGGVHMYIGSNVSMEGCMILSNRSTNNGGGIWNQGGVLYMNYCTISGNASGQQAAGLYSIDSGTAASICRIYNTTIADNDNTQVNVNRSGGGAYIREGSDAVFVNCTFTGNKAGYGGGIMGYGTAARPSKTTCISCTITGNSANGSAGGGGVIVYNANGAIALYNSIVSGNTSASGVVDAGINGALDASLLTLRYTVNGTALMGGDGTAVGGWSFAASTMLGTYGFNNGGLTRTWLLVDGASNPAVGQGMTVAQLQDQAAALAPAVESTVVAADQNGTARGGRSIGSVTAQ